MKFNLFSREIFVWCALLCACLTSVSVVAQVNDENTSWKNEKITMRVSALPLGDVLDKVAQKANAKIVYRNVAIRGINHKITLNVKEKPLHSVIEDLLKDQEVKIQYESGRRIVLMPSPRKAVSENRGIRFPVSGVVYEKDTKEPLVGATVLVESSLKNGRPIGIQTDLDGKFSLTVPENSILKVSFVGFESEKYVVTKPDSDITIYMSPDALSIGEVVVTGISKRSKNSFTGNFVNIKGDDLRRMNPTDLLKSLQFFDPSFKISENIMAGADPNAQISFQMRGDQSFGRGTSNLNSMDLMLDNVSARPNTPLFVLDGFIVPVSRVLRLDPERVESITILKDAAATAIYGSKASNGVVVVETKVARDGALSLSYNTNLTIQTPDLTDYNMMNAAEKLETEKLAGLYPDGDVRRLNEYNRYRRNILAGVDTYWLSQPLRTAFQQRHTINVGGGTEVFRYNINLNAGLSPGVMKGSASNTKAIDFNMSYRRDNLTVGADVNLTETYGKNSPYGSFGMYTNVNPYYRPYDDNGEYLKVLDMHRATGTGHTINNPLYNAHIGIKNFTNNLNIASTLNLEYRLLTNLRLSEQISYTRGMARAENFLPASHTSFIQVSDLTKRGRYAKNIGELSSWSSNLGLNWNLSLSKHLFSVFANWLISENKSNYVNLSATGYPDVHMDDFIFGNDMDTNPSGSEAIARSMGLITQFSYSYDNRYSFDFNLSGEASSRFGAGQRLAPFWSTGLRWNAHEESWLQGRVSNLVMRATYGITGEQNFNPYEAIEFYTFSRTLKPYKSFANLGAVMSGLNNPNLGWAKTDNLSIGMDLGVWNNRINTTINYYNNITRNLLTQYDLAPSTGFDSQTMNAGELQNEGVDVTLNVIAIQDFKNEFFWTISANANHNENKIRKISDFLKKINEEQLKSASAPRPIYQVGQSTSTLYSVPSLGIDPITGREVYLKRDGSKTFIWDAVDKEPIGDTSPKISGTISSSVNWKDFSLMLGFSYKYGGIVYNSTLVDKIENANLSHNLDRRAMQGRWSKVGDVTRYKKFIADGDNTPNSTRFIMNDNELRCSTINLGYRMNDRKYSFLKKLKVESLALNFTTNELFRLSSIRMERGLNYPFARTYTFSLSVLFK